MVSTSALPHQLFSAVTPSVEASSWRLSPFVHRLLYAMRGDASVTKTAAPSVSVNSFPTMVGVVAPGVKRNQWTVLLWAEGRRLLQQRQQFGRLEHRQRAGSVVLHVSSDQVLRAGLHGGHHLDGVVEVGVGQVQCLFDRSLVDRCN
jgi:hypothetical protein